MDGRKRAGIGTIPQQTTAKMRPREIRLVRNSSGCHAAHNKGGQGGKQDFFEAGLVSTRLSHTAKSLATFSTSPAEKENDRECLVVSLYSHLSRNVKSGITGTSPSSAGGLYEAISWKVVPQSSQVLESLNPPPPVNKEHLYKEHFHINRKLAKI